MTTHLFISEVLLQQDGNTDILLTSVNMLLTAMSRQEFYKKRNPEDCDTTDFDYDSLRDSSPKAILLVPSGILQSDPDLYVRVLSSLLHPIRNQKAGFVVAA